MNDEPSIEERLTRLEAQGGAGSPAPASKLDRAVRYLPYIAIAHVAIGAPTLLLTLVLAYATFVQADATRKMQQGGALPIITYGTSNVNEEGEPEISLTLSNNGVGPALLGPMEMRYEGAIVRNPRDLLRRCCGVEARADLSFATSPSSGVAVRPGEATGFFRLKQTPDNQIVWDRLNAERWKLNVRTCYCSIFEDCWVVEGMQSRPRPVESCPVDWAAYAEDPSPHNGDDRR